MECAIVPVMRRDGSTSPLDPGLMQATGALVLALGALGGALLWVRFGEVVYFDRLFTTIANCF